MARRKSVFDQYSDIWACHARLSKHIRAYRNGKTWRRKWSNLIVDILRATANGAMVIINASVYDASLFIDKPAIIIDNSLARLPKGKVTGKKQCIRPR